MKKCLTLFLFFFGFALVSYAETAPVEFTYLGISPDKQNVQYTIKVNSDKPITQVDIGMKYLDVQGKVLMDTPFLWQNIVKSTKQPIEKGKTYKVDDYLYPDSAKVEAKLLRVHFQDGSQWSAPK